MSEDLAALQAVKAHSAAVRMLGQREHSCAEIRQKLRRKFSALEVSCIESLIEEFVERGWLSDQRFAEVLVRSRANRGYGPYYIRRELATKGIDDTQAESALESAEIDWYESAVGLIGRRFPEAGCDLQVWEKAARFLQRRGFSGDVVRKALGARP